MWKALHALEGEDFLREQKKRAHEIAGHHFARTECYREKVGSRLPERWEDLPVMRKGDFQRPLKALISRDYSMRQLYVANTSGSSGHPFYYAKDKLAHALTWAEIKSLYALHGLGMRSLQARFYGIPLSGRARRVELWKDRLLHRMRFPVFDLSDEVLSSWIDRFRRHAFRYLYGYTSSLVYFARYCAERGVVLKSLCPSLQLCMVTSEVCTQQDRKVLEAGFGVRVVNEYGASEVGLIAFEHPDGKWRLCEELLYVEAVDEEGKAVPDGMPGRLLITSLFNRAMPFIRYEIGDIGVLQTLPSGKRCLLSLEGRTNDFVRLPSGKTAPGLTFYYIARGLLESSSFVKEFIIRQTALDVLEFVIVSDRMLNEREKQLIQNKMDEYLEPGLKLIVKQVDKIDRASLKGGKVKHFYSDLE